MMKPEITVDEFVKLEVKRLTEFKESYKKKVSDGVEGFTFLEMTKDEWFGEYSMWHLS